MNTKSTQSGSPSRPWPSNTNSVEIGLNASIVAMNNGRPSILVVTSDNQPDALPYGPFNPSAHRTMEIGVRGFVEEQAGIKLGYIEQLYTFGDRGRYRDVGDESPHVVSVGYLALARVEEGAALQNASWKDWYTYLPWEDWRKGRPSILDATILPKLKAWVEHANNGSGTDSYQSQYLQKSARVRVAFGLDGAPWDDELVLDRYELIYSAGLLEEAVVDGRVAKTGLAVPLGLAMLHDHRRILATAMSRLRGKLKYRPVIFELMSEEFTLLDLQQTVESIAGRSVHKQNFRRLVEKAQLVEPTGTTSLSTGGRPAAMFRFRREVVAERPAPGLKVGRS